MPDSDVNPISENPLTEFRLAQSNGAGWSLSKLSREIGVSESTIIRTEQGLYNDIPPRILYYLADRFLSPGSVAAQYSRFQISRRHQLYLHGRLELNFRKALTILCEKYPERNPFLLWRESAGVKGPGYKSRLAFCKDLCLHPSTVKRYEDGLAERMPDSMRNALMDVRVDWETIDECYKQWRNGSSKEGTTLTETVAVL